MFSSTSHCSLDACVVTALKHIQRLIRSFFLVNILPFQEPANDLCLVGLFESQYKTKQCTETSMNGEAPRYLGKENDIPIVDFKIPNSILIPAPPIVALTKSFRSISLEEELKSSDRPVERSTVSPRIDSRRPSAPTPEHPRNRALLRDCFVFQPILQDDERESILSNQPRLQSQPFVMKDTTQ